MFSYMQYLFALVASHIFLFRKARAAGRLCPILCPPYIKNHRT